MATFLFASIAVQAHTTNPLPIAARLVERGNTVLRDERERDQETGLHTTTQGEVTLHEPEE